MNSHEEERLKQMLRAAIEPVGAGAEPARDLWPAMLARMTVVAPRMPWYDWALAGSVAVLAAFFPASIPLLLYYL
ncbi:MAG: hypothetical protein WCE75_10275 [Terracidiphilus sp.]